MKKGISIVALLCCLVSMFLMPAAFASNLPSTGMEGELVYLNRDALTPITSLNSEPQNFSAQPRVQTGPATANSEYVIVMPVIYDAGEYYVLDVGYRFGPVSGFSYIRGSLSLANQETLKDYVRNNGYEPVGWYIEGSYYLQCYRPGLFRYYTLSHDGQSSMMGQSAKNGSNVFGVLGLYPQDTTAGYTYGIKGTVSYSEYWPSLTANPILNVEKGIELSIEFENK